jgi:hypothetical protein
MKYIIQVILLLFVLSAHSQNKKKKDPVKQLSSAATLTFTADNSGCFGGEIISYRISKLKSGERKVVFEKGGTEQVKKLSQKDFDQFLQNYSSAYRVFKDDKIRQTCTSVSVFSIRGTKDSLGFKNVTCQGELNPEFLLIEKMK